MALRLALKVLLGVFLGGTLISCVGPILGEMIATLPPLFPDPELNPFTYAGLLYENVAFRTEDGLTLRGWFIPASDEDAPAIVYAPGTGHDLRSGLVLAEPFHRAGYHILLFSYRGYGESEGNELGFTYGDRESRDIDAAVRYLKVERKQEKVAVIGFSAGAAGAIVSAARNPTIDAVVAAASFTSLSEVWNSNSPSVMPAFLREWALRLTEWRKGFRRDAIQPLAVVSRISPRPVLFIQGEQDARVSVQAAHQLLEAAGRPAQLWVVKGATHHTIQSEALHALAPDIIAFLDNVLRGKEMPARGYSQVSRLGPLSLETAKMGAL